MRQKLVVGNWKMNGLSEDVGEIEQLIANAGRPHCDVVICPPHTLIARAYEVARGSVIMIGAQDCHQQRSGAHTGDVSAEMLADAGASHVILGHSERRKNCAETDALVAGKVWAACEQNLVAIVCVGETESEREAGDALAVVEQQLAASIPEVPSPDKIVVAYEPVWAIGAGRTPALDQISQVHAFIRAKLVARFGALGSGIRLLYGGSVKPSNASEIFNVPDVDGALVGGASLKARDFSQILSAFAA